MAANNGALTEPGDGGQRRKIAVPVEHEQPVSDRTRGDQAVDARSDGPACSSGATIKIHSFVEHGGPERGLDDGERVHRVVRSAKRPLVAESLEDFLHDRQTGDDLFEIDLVFEADTATPEDLDPNGRVNENHAAFASGCGPMRGPGA